MSQAQAAAARPALRRDAGAGEVAAPPSPARSLPARFGRGARIGGGQSAERRTGRYKDARAERWGPPPQESSAGEDLLSRGCLRARPGAEPLSPGPRPRARSGSRLQSGAGREHHGTSVPRWRSAPPAECGPGGWDGWLCATEHFWGPTTLSVGDGGVRCAPGCVPHPLQPWRPSFSGHGDSQGLRPSVRGERAQVPLGA